MLGVLAGLGLAAVAIACRQRRRHDSPPLQEYARPRGERTLRFES